MFAETLRSARPSVHWSDLRHSSIAAANKTTFNAFANVGPDNGKGNRVRIPLDTEPAGAVRNLARSWAEDLKGTGIRVNMLSPGATATELAKESLGEEGQKVYAAMTPLQRMADPWKIGAAAAFLASSDSNFMIASEVAVDGGLAQLSRARPRSTPFDFRSEPT